MTDPVPATIRPDGWPSVGDADEPETRRVRYVTVRPGRLVTQLWIEVRSTGPHASQADMPYRAPCPAPRDAPGSSTSSPDSRRKPHWERAIAGALRRPPETDAPAR